jgi:hypothetical protein
MNVYLLNEAGNGKQMLTILAIYEIPINPHIRPIPSQLIGYFLLSENRIGLGHI